jgi:hypothetical protein
MAKLAGKMKFSELNASQQAFLKTLKENPAYVKPNDPCISVYCRRPDGVFFIEDFQLPTKAQKEFEKNAGTYDLFRGGGVIKIRWNDNWLVLADDRYKWIRPVGGASLFCEGEDLIKTGLRELMEELFVYSLDHKTRFVPGGTNINRKCVLGFETPEVMKIGKIQVLDYYCNESNRAFEAVLHWDISDIDVAFSINMEEDFFRGGLSGITVLAVNNEKALVGMFSSQQGYIDFTSLKIHPTLETYWLHTPSSATK